MLTTQQLVAIEILSSTRPLHVGDLHKKFSPGPLSLRSIIHQVETRKATLFVQVRDTSILKSVTNLAQFQTAWKTSVPSKATLAQLTQLLSANGGSITYLSKDWQTVGIAGTTGSLASTSGRFLDLKTGILELGGATATEAGLIITLIPVGGLAAGIVFIVGSIAAGAVASVGLFDIFFSDSETSLPSSEPIVRPEITIY